MKVLIVEDDIQLTIILTKFLEKKGFYTISVKCGLDAIEYIDNISFDLYLVDINIPSISGLEVVNYIRQYNKEVPVIILTASLELDNFVKAFENGCSEYIKKPFHLKELEIRMSALIDLDKVSQSITFEKDFYYDQKSKKFYYDENEVIFRYKEKKLLDLLIAHCNNTVSNETIYSFVWENEERDSYPLRQLVNTIRKKLPYDIIRTKVKEGYVIEVKK